MEKEYNFEHVGKRMPYAMPHDFFNKMQANVLAEVEREERKKLRPQARIRRLYLSMAAVAASICLVVLVVKSLLVSTSNSHAVANMVLVDKAYDNLTEEEQEEVNDTYANDIYLSMQ